MTPHRKQKTTYAERQAARAAYRVKRDAEIREAVKAGVPLVVLRSRYQITMERVRQISRTPAPV
jgi:rRNA-processing protein FCF1